MGRRVVLLKSGRSVSYLLCDCCNNYARGLSRRGWCSNCEYEFSDVGRRVRARNGLLPFGQPRGPA